MSTSSYGLRPTELLCLAAGVRRSYEERGLQPAAKQVPGHHQSHCQMILVLVQAHTAGSDRKTPAHHHSPSAARDHRIRHAPRRGSGFSRCPLGQVLHADLGAALARAWSAIRTKALLQVVVEGARSRLLMVGLSDPVALI